MASYLETEDLLPDEDTTPEQEADVIEEKLITENINAQIKLDYKLKTAEERAQLVARIVEETPQAQLTSRYLEILGDYIMGGISKEEKKSKQYLTDNRLITINKRETSFEGLAEKFENGEDGIYNLMTNDKNMILTPKVSITEDDIRDIPGMRELREMIQETDARAKAAVGRKKYLLKKQLIEMRKDQYVLKSIFKPTIGATASSNRGLNKIDLTEERYLDDNNEPCSEGLISFLNPDHICALLCNYSALKLETAGHYSNDFFYLLQDFEALIHQALKEQPLYLDLIKLKIKGKSNLEIQKELEKRHDKKYSVEYISALWRNKIPKIIAEYEKQRYIVWLWENTPGAPWKTCTRCGEKKPAHQYFYSKNKTSKDGWYSLCKNCRNSKDKK